MSHNTAIPLSPELEEKFKKSVEPGQNTRVRFFQVRIQNETLVATHVADGGSSIDRDYDSMSNLANETEACYFLFRLDGQKSWLVITFVPNGVSVKDKMVYAATKGTLKNKLGFGYFTDELHITSKDELSYSKYKGDKAPIDSRSDTEKVFADMQQQEEVERKERALQPHGGYHSVVIPLSDDAQSALNRLKSGEINFVELALNEGHNHIQAIQGKSVPVSQLSREINTSEPRFYILIYGIPPKNVFLYCCPDKSPQKLRMIYSTTKPAVVDQVNKLGVNLAVKKIEISDPEDLTDEFLRTQLTPSVIRSGVGGRGSAPDLGGQVKAASVNKVAQHPIYSLMSPTSPGGKKKIVLPPPGAYQ